MEAIRTFTHLFVFLATGSILLACSVNTTPTAIPATVAPILAPTAIPPTAAPDTPTATSEPTAPPTLAATAIPPTAAPTNTPAATATPAGASGAKIVTDVFAALANRDVDGALKFVDENVIFDIAGNSGIGSAALRPDLQLAQTVGTTFAVSNVQELGGIVTFTVTVSGFGAGTYSNSSMIVEDGKIVILTIK